MQGRILGPVFMIIGKYPKLEIGFHGESELFDKNTFEGCDAVLFIKQQHGFLIVYGVHGAERQRTISGRYQHGIADDTGRALIAVVERLDIRDQQEQEQCFLENGLPAVDQSACFIQSLPYLKLVIQRTVIRTRYTHTPYPDIAVNIQL